MGTILSIIIKYWIEFLLGLVVMGGTWFIKRFVKMVEEERKRANDALKEEIGEQFNNMAESLKKSSEEGDAVLQRQIDAITAGLLSMQGREFKQECRRLLDDKHVITLEEWEEISEDHRAYNGLKGNHKGDELFDLVKKKAENTLTGVK